MTLQEKLAKFKAEADKLKEEKEKSKSFKDLGTYEVEFLSDEVYTTKAGDVKQLLKFKCEQGVINIYCGLDTEVGKRIYDEYKAKIEKTQKEGTQLYCAIVKNDKNPEYPRYYLSDEPFNFNELEAGKSHLCKIVNCEARQSQAGNYMAVITVSKKDVEYLIYLTVANAIGYNIVSDQLKSIGLTIGEFTPKDVESVKGKMVMVKVTQKSQYKNYRFETVE